MWISLSASAANAPVDIAIPKAAANATRIKDFITQTSRKNRPYFNALLSKVNWKKSIHRAPPCENGIAQMKGNAAWERCCPTMAVTARAASDIGLSHG